jgi:hypothetical protein
VRRWSSCSRPVDPSLPRKGLPLLLPLGLPLLLPLGLPSPPAPRALCPRDLPLVPAGLLVTRLGLLVTPLELSPSPTRRFTLLSSLLLPPPLPSCRPESALAVSSAVPRRARFLSPVVTRGSPRPGETGDGLEQRRVRRLLAVMSLLLCNSRCCCCCCCCCAPVNLSGTS